MRRIDLSKLFTVITGLDPAIPIMWHSRASLSGMAGSSPAMTIPCKPKML
jgi:hypothetical protein